MLNFLILFLVLTFLNHKQVYLLEYTHLFHGKNHRLNHEYFLSVSVCTAFTRNEEVTCIHEGYELEHPDFEDGRLLNVDSLNEVLPFKRYDFDKGLRLFEVIDGTEISPDSWSLKDHTELMSKVNIYDWNYISKFSYS